MTESRSPQAGPDAFAPIDPYALTRREQAGTQLRRFYKEAVVGERDGRFMPLLDGRPIRTPARNDVVVPGRAAAQALVDEWNRQGGIILPGTMPLGRLVNTAIDGVTRAAAEVRAEIVQFAGSDLLCYRADAPAELVELQSREWDPVLAWSRDALGARLYLAEGVMFVAQPEHALNAIAQAVEASVGSGAEAPFRLSALHVMTTLTGSALLGLAVLGEALSPEDAWHKAHVDEDFQIGRWGEDAEAATRRLLRWDDMSAAARLVQALDQA